MTNARFRVGETTHLREGKPDLAGVSSSTWTRPLRRPNSHIGYVSCRVAVLKQELEGGVLSSTLEKTDGGGRVREESL